MDDDLEAWQRRIQDLYANVEELYSHVDITVAVFDQELVEVSAGHGRPASPFAEQLLEVARRVRATGEPERDIALDAAGRQRAHAFPLHIEQRFAGVVCVVDDDGARRELFVRCAMALFDGYRQNEAALLERERKALDEAQRANKLRDQFMAVIAHELRAPMASILLWEQLLRDPALAAVNHTAALDAIHESASGQALLVADLVDVSRAINGKLYIDRRPTSLAPIIGRAVETLRPRATARGIELVADVDPGVGAVLGDSRRLRQVLDNLLSNAINCTDHGRVSLRAWPHDDSITIEVSDTGRGIAAEFIPHLFEPFKRADETSEGLGLGLGIARWIIELHGGTLTAESAGLGQGARFTASVPRFRGDVTATERSRIAGIRLLLVDDDPRLLVALQLLLERVGALVTTAGSAAAAYAILERGRIEVVVSDLGMPVEDGFSFVRRIRASEQGATLPTIAITSRLSQDDRDRALSAGFDRYLTKPLDMDLLVSNIVELVERKPQ